MTVFQAAILGIIQGITEFLPISSSGHLIFVPKIFGWADQGLSFDAVVHLGTLVAVVVYFRQRLWGIARGFFVRTDESRAGQRLGLLLMLSVIPAGLAGYFGGDWVETHTRSASVIAFGLIFWGVALFLADRYSRQRQDTVDMSRLSWKKTAWIACAQAIALIPGTSRSGITMTAGLFAKLDKKSAAEFSFLMSVPIIFLGGAVKVAELLRDGAGDAASAAALLAGFVCAAVSGFFAIAGLMKIIQRWSYTPFVVYRVIVGVLILLFLVSG